MQKIGETEIEKLSTALSELCTRMESAKSDLDRARKDENLAVEKINGISRQITEMKLALVSKVNDLTEGIGA